MADSQAYRRKFFLSNSVFLGICVVILVLVYNLNNALSGGKADWTEDNVYTVSDATKEILGGLVDTVKVEYFVSAELPSVLQNLQRDTRDTFEEFKELSGGNFDYTIVDPEERAESYAAEQVEAYYQAKAEGKTPKEPKMPQSIEDIFSRRQPPTDEEKRNLRDQQAAAAATAQGRKKDEVYNELLAEEFKREFKKKLEQQRIFAFPIQETEADSVRQVKVYSSIRLSYLDKQPEVLPVHYQIENLEYEIASRVLKLTNGSKPSVAFFDARKPAAPPPNPMSPTPPPPSDYEGVVGFLGELFDVRRIDLKENDAIEDLVKRLKRDKWDKDNKDNPDKDDSKFDETVNPEDFKLLRCLIVAQPHNLGPRQVLEINRAASLGVKTIFLMSRYSLDASRQGSQRGLPIITLDPGSEFEDMLRSWGIELGNELLASNECAHVEVPQRMGPFQVMAPYRFAMTVAPSERDIDQESTLTNRIPRLIFPATTGFKVNQEMVKKAELKHTVLVSMPDQTWSVKVDPFARLKNPMMRNQGPGITALQYRDQLIEMKDPAVFRDFLSDKLPLVVQLTGKLPFNFQGETIPEWKKEETPPSGGPPGIPGLPGGLPSGHPPLGDGDVELNADDPDLDVALLQDEDAPKPPEAVQTPAPAEKPAEPQPAETQPAEPQPAETQPAETQPAETEPAETQPAETKPAEPQPAETQPAETKPAETQPAETKPAETKEEEKKEPQKITIEPREGVVLLVATADSWKDAFLGQQTREYQGNVGFLQNAVENYALGDLLINIRRKQLTARRFEPGSDKWYRWIIALNVAVVPVIVGAIGLVYFLIRRSQSSAYERAYLTRRAAAN